MDDQALEPWRPRRVQAVDPWQPRKRPRGECSSSAPMAADFDVFLNHRGPDAKAGFVAHLDEALRAAGLNPFLDKASLKEGDHAFGCIEDALQMAKVHVAIVSKGYAESKYCLSELVAMLRSGKPIIPVYYEVEPAQLRWMENGPFATAFKKHKCKREQVQVEEWRDVLGKLADITGFCFCSSDYKSDEVDLKWEVVHAILSKFRPAGEALHVDHHMVSVKEHMNFIFELEKLEKLFNTTCSLGLVGMGGVGKTYLAKVIFNHFASRKKFQAVSFLAIDHNTSSSMDIGPNSLKRLQKELLWDVLHIPRSNEQSFNYWFHKLSMWGPIQVVLDDIYDKSQFDELILDTKFLAQGSCIIMITCDQHALKVIEREFDKFYLHDVTPLGSDDSQKLFNLYAFGKVEAPKKFKAIAIDVNNACGGLPLALKVVGSSLFDKKSNEDLECIWPEAVNALKGDRNVMNALQWSYDNLSQVGKLMFVDVACVFCSWKKEEAMEIWKSCKNCLSCAGYAILYTTLRELVDKSLVVLNNSKNDDVLTMHDLLQVLNQSIGILNGSHLCKYRGTNVVEESHEESEDAESDT